MTRANWTSATAWLDRPPPFHPWKLFFKAYPTKSLSLPLYPTIFSLYPSGLSHSLSLGGAQGKDSALGKVIGPSFSAAEVPAVIERIVETFTDLRVGPERFIDTFNRVGLEPFKARVYARMEEPA